MNRIEDGVILFSLPVKTEYFVAGQKDIENFLEKLESCERVKLQTRKRDKTTDRIRGDFANEK